MLGVLGWELRVKWGDLSQARTYQMWALLMISGDLPAWNALGDLMKWRPYGFRLIQSRRREDGPSDVGGAGLGIEGEVRRCGSGDK
jgi:hypothetical protein